MTSCWNSSTNWRHKSTLRRKRFRICNITVRKRPGGERFLYLFFFLLPWTSNAVQWRQIDGVAVIVCAFARLCKDAWSLGLRFGEARKRRRREKAEDEDETPCHRTLLSTRLTWVTWVWEWYLDNDDVRVLQTQKNANVLFLNSKSWCCRKRSRIKKPTPSSNRREFLHKVGTKHSLKK